MKRYFIVKWTDLELPGWTRISSLIFKSKEDAHRYAQRWYRLHAEESDRYRVIELKMNNIYKKEDL